MRVGQTYYIKGVTVRFGFDVLELRKLEQIVKNKATGTPHGMLYTILIGYCSCEQYAHLVYYMHQRGAFNVARFDNLGNAKALTRGTSDRLAPRFFMLICMTNNTNSHLGANDNLYHKFTCNIVY